MRRKQYSEISWTPNLAYAIGLLTTDGNLSNDSRHITLTSSDLEILENFKSCLIIQNKIKQRYNNGYAKNPIYHIQFSNVRLYDWLCSIGLHPKKTHTIGEIFVPNEFFRDFLRGHLDGDGSIVVYDDTYNIYKGKRYLNRRVFTKFISASQIHIEWIYQTLHKLTGIVGSIQCDKSHDLKRVPLWVLKISKKNSIKLFPWIYYNDALPTLKRKQLKAQEFMR